MGSQALAKLLAVGYSSRDVYLHCAPLFHIGGLSSALAVLAAGAVQARTQCCTKGSCHTDSSMCLHADGTAGVTWSEICSCSAPFQPATSQEDRLRCRMQVFMPAFSAPAALALVAQHSVSALIAVPAMLVDLLAAQHDADHSKARQGYEPGSALGCPSVRRVLLGGGEVPASLVWRARLLFPNAMLTTAYGMTEACSSITFQPLGSAHQAWAAGGSAFGGGDSSKTPEGVCEGLPPPGVEIAVLPLCAAGSGDSGACGEAAHASTGRAADADGVRRCGRGEVLTRGPHAMLRYWGDPAATSAAFVEPAAASEARCATRNAPASPLAANQNRTGGREVVGAGGSCPHGSVQHLPQAPSDSAGCSDTALDAEHITEATSRMQDGNSAPEGLGRRAGGFGPSSGAWLRTGDLGTVDACGRLWLAGRLKDVVRSGGENVNAAEVERVLVRHPAVAAAAVVGLPHARLGEQVAALLVLRPGFRFHPDPDPGAHHDSGPGAGATAMSGAGPAAGTMPGSLDLSVSAQASPGAKSSARALTPAGLGAFCRAQGLAGFKVPRAVAAQESPLPANSAGKVLKGAVRAELLRRLAAPAVLHSRM